MYLTYMSTFRTAATKARHQVYSSKAVMQWLS